MARDAGEVHIGRRGVEVGAEIAFVIVQGGGVRDSKNTLEQV